MHTCTHICTQYRRIDMLRSSLDCSLLRYCHTNHIDTLHSTNIHNDIHI
jgi:hypothetical protein